MGEGNHRTEEESGSEADLIEELCMEEPGDEVVSCWDDGGGDRLPNKDNVHQKNEMKEVTLELNEIAQVQTWR